MARSTRFFGRFNKSSHCRWGRNPAAGRYGAGRFLRRLTVENLEARQLLSVDPSVGGVVWKDANLNGVQDVGEPGLVGAAVELYSSSDAVVGNADDTLLARAVTDAAGRYSISGLAAGINCYLVFRVPSGYEFTTQDAGGNDNVDSDVDASGVTALFTLQTDTMRDAGLSGSAPGFGFALRAGAGGDDWMGNAMATDASGNVLITGSFQAAADFDPGPGVYNLSSDGGCDTFVAKYSPAGALVWARSAGAADLDYGLGIAVAPDGSVYTTGCFTGTVDFDPGANTFNLTSAGSSDIFVRKLDSGGNLVWARRMGGAHNDGGYTIALAADGSVYTSGWFNGVADFDPGPGVYNLTSVDVSDFFVCKLDGSGNFLWARDIGANHLPYSPDSPGSGSNEWIALAADGSVYSAGQFRYTVDFDPGPGTFELTAAGGSDIFVSKLDPAGNFVWARNMGGGGEAYLGNDYTGGVAVGPDGSVLVTGDFPGTADFDLANSYPDNRDILTSAGGYDAFVLKLDSAGNLVWVRNMGGPGTSGTGNAMVVGADGSVYTTGWFMGTADFDPGPGTFDLSSAGNRDIFVSKLNSAGGFVWARSMGGTGGDGGLAIALAPDGSVYTAGGFQATADFDPGSGVFELTSAGGYDVFLLKLSSAYLDPVNTAPAITSLAVTPQPLNEGGTATLAGAFTDPDATQTHTVSIDWGDGSSVTTVNLAAGVTSIPATTHQYLDNRPANAACTISVTVTDSANASGTGTTTASVLNVAPMATINGAPATSPEGTAISLTSTVTDPSPVDQAAGFAYSWDVTKVHGATTTPHYATGTTANFSFTPDDDGTYTVTLVATDKDGGASSPATVTIAATPVNHAPVADDDAYTVNEDSVLTVAPVGALPLAKTQLLDYFVQGIEVADVDNDGTMELVATDPAGRRVMVYDRTYALKYSVPFSEVPRGVAIADLDQDGRNELVVAASGVTGYDARNLGQGGDSSGHVTIGEVTSAGTWTAQWTSPALYVRYAQQMVVGDFNGNGKTELVWGGTYYDRKLVAYEYNGSTYAQIFQDAIGSDVNSVAAAGNRLLVGTANWSDNALRVYDNYSLVFRSDPDGLTFVAGGDVDGDGAVELVKGVAAKNSTWYPMPRLRVYDGGTFALDYLSPTLIDDSRGFVFTVAAGELLGGGGQEIVGGTVNWWTPLPGTLWLFQHNGTSYQQVWQESFTSQTGGVYFQKFCDFDGDGRNELYVSTSTGLLVYRPASAGGGVLANDTDADGDQLTAAVVAPPAHGTVSFNADGSFTYTPDANYNGADSFTYRAYDGSAYSNVAMVHITVNPVNDAPAAVADSFATDEDTALAGSVLANDPDVDGDVLSAALVGGAAHGAVVLNANGSFTYTPAADFNGADSFTYKAYDGQAYSDAATVTITVNPVNDAPVATSQSVTTDEDTPKAITLAASDVDGDALTYRVIAPPAQGTLSGSGASLTYTPGPDFNGVDSFTYRANDGQADSNDAVVVVFVAPVNDPPVAIADNFATSEDTALTGSVLANDIDADGDVLAAALVSGPSHGTVSLSGDGSFVYTPAANYNGADSFIYRASDAVTVPQVLFSDNFNRPDSGDTDSVTTGMGGPLAPLAYDERETATIAGSRLSLNGGTSWIVPQHDFTDAAIAASGGFVMEMDINPPDSSAGPANWVGVSFGMTRSVAEGGAHRVGQPNAMGILLRGNIGSAAGCFRTFNATNYSVEPGFTYDASPSAAEWYHLKLTVKPQAGQGLFTVGNLATADIEITGDLDANQGAPSTDTYRAQEVFDWINTSNYMVIESYYAGLVDNLVVRTLGVAADSEATVAIAVNPVNDAPLAASQSVTADEDTPLAITLSGSDVETPAGNLLYTVTVAPQHGTLSGSGPNLTYTPAPNYNGPDSFQYTVTDNGDPAGIHANPGDLTSAPAMVSITVTPVNDAPVAVDDAYSTDEDTALGVSAPGLLTNDSDADGDPLTAALVTAPAHGSLTLNSDGSFTYIPGADFHGTDTFQYRAGDGTAPTSEGAVQWRVTAGGNGHWYQAVPAPETISWNDAKAAAESAGGHLASILSQAENAFAYSLIEGDSRFWHTAGTDTIGPWLGGYQAPGSTEPGGGWRWVSDEPWSYSNWASGEPNNGWGVEDKLAFIIKVGGTGPQWNDLVDSSWISVLRVTGYIVEWAEQPAGAASVATVTVNINPVNDPPVALDQSVTTHEDTPKDITLAASDVEGDALGYSVVSGPAHGTLSGTAPNLVYTPALDYNGTDRFTYKANDGQTDSNVGEVTITVSAVNDPPVAVDDAYGMDEDTTLTVSAPGVLGNDNDVDGDSLTAALVTGPAHGSLGLNADGSFTYAPRADFHGTDSFQYRSSDGNGPTPGGPVQWRVSDGGNGHWYQAVSAPETISWNDANAAAESAGGHLASILSQAENAFAYGLVADDTRFWHTAGTDIIGPWLGGYQAPGSSEPGGGWHWVSNEPWSYSNWASGEPNNGWGVEDKLAFIIKVGGPGAQWNDLVDSSWISVLRVTGYIVEWAEQPTDQAGVATVTITVDPVNDRPTAHDKAVSADEDTAVTITLSGSDVETAAADLVYTVTVSPQHGTLNGSGPSLTYTPAPNYNGPDSFQYTVTDNGDPAGSHANPADLTSLPATVSITVAPVNDPPVLDPIGDKTVNEGCLLTFTASAHDVDLDGLTFSLGPDAPAGAAIDPVTGVFTWTPPDGAADVPVTIVVTDDGGPTLSDAETITVTVLNAAPTLTADGASVTTGEGQAVSNTGTWNDVPADRPNVTLTASVGNVVKNNDGTWEWSCTPTDGPAVGLVTITATDGEPGGASTTTFQLVVANLPPSAAINGPESGTAGTEIALISVVTDPSPADQAAEFGYAWSVTKDGNPYGSGDQPDFAFTPDTAGAYVVTLVATDKDGAASNEASHTVSVTSDLVEFSGCVFDDRDNNGLFDGSDEGIAGVTVELYDQATGTWIAEGTTGPDGLYSIRVNVGPGTYKLVEGQPPGLLDGKETAGSLGGSVDNTQDCNTIADILVGAGDSQASAYNFAEIRASRLQGMVWEDYNDNGEVDLGEKAIAGAAIRLTGTDDRARAVDLLMATNGQGIFEFIDLRPGNYTLRETQPIGYADGRDTLGTVNGLPSGTMSNDLFSEVVLPRPGSDGVNYNFGERPLPGVQPGQTATIGFWQNKNGQNLIKSLNGSASSTQLGNWLASNFPNMYGSGGPGGVNLAGKTNLQVADIYTSLFKRTAKSSPGGPPKLDAQVMAVALAVYVTNASLAGQAAVPYGFLVTASGVGYSTFDVGSANRAAFGLSATDSTVLTVLDILMRTDAKTRKGILYDENGNGLIDSFETMLRTMANDVYSAINEQGHIA
jgi:VCBS repeat-containing protein